MPGGRLNRVQPPCAVLLTMALGLASCLANREVPRVATVPVGQWPEDIAFDPGSARVFVAEEDRVALFRVRDL